MPGMRACRTGVAATLCAVCLAAVGASDARADPRLAPLATIGLWPVVSGLFGYGNRRWLVNSVRFV